MSCDHICDHLVKRRPEVLEVNVSCTTRAMRWLSFTSVFVVAPPVIMLVRFKHDSAWLALAALISPSMLQHAARAAVAWHSSLSARSCFWRATPWSARDKNFN